MKGKQIKVVINRTDIPSDALSILKMLVEKIHDVNFIRHKAREVLKRDGKVYPWPVQSLWLRNTLLKAYPASVVLSIIGDVARIMTKRGRGPKQSNTTCIACGSWIPIDREERGNPTCSGPCYRWWRCLRRAIDANKECRYCGHGLPKATRKTIRRRRPGRQKAVVSSLIGNLKNDAEKGYGAVRHIRATDFPKGETTPLRPDGPSKAPFQNMQEQLEEARS